MPIQIRVASPCTKDWNQMQGTAQKRFCEGCRLHVYDLSAMTFDEVREVLEMPVPPCVRFYQRADGTVMTADCPVGKARARRKWRQVATVVVALVAGAIAWLRQLGDEPECAVSVALPAVRSASTPAVEPPPSDDWMNERRARLSPATTALRQGRLHTMGVILNVIRK